MSFLFNFLLLHQIVEQLESIEYCLVHIEVLIAGQPPDKGHARLLKQRIVSSQLEETKPFY